MSLKTWCFLTPVIRTIYTSLPQPGQRQPWFRPKTCLSFGSKTWYQGSDNFLDSCGAIFFVWLSLSLFLKHFNRKPRAKASGVHMPCLHSRIISFPAIPTTHDRTYGQATKFIYSSPFLAVLYGCIVPRLGTPLGTLLSLSASSFLALPMWAHM